MRKPLLILAALAASAQMAVAQTAVERSIRPEIRPTAAVVLSTARAPIPGAAVLRSLRPEARPAAFANRTQPSPEPRRAPLQVTREDETVAPAPSNLGFRTWIAGFRSRAQAQGIRSEVFDRAFAGIRYDADVISKDRNQSEFTKAIWDYLDSAVSRSRVVNGREALSEWRTMLGRIEDRYGVEAEVVVAVWGLETAYGAVRGNTPIVEALATLAYDGRRGAFFEEQLIAALRIIQSGDVAPKDMRGSWAGAMGHTQFMPTSYLEHAQDFDGDGRRDIWSDIPVDALASTAAYLKHFGWTKGQPWGVEVTLPAGFDYALSGEKIKKPVSFWMRQGVRNMDGDRVPNHGRASILLPAGAEGAAFMIFDNFHVIERYNPADAYVIGVGHLSDRFAGGPPIQAAWPRGDRPLRFSERQEMQRRLTAAGYDTFGVDGLIGPNTVSAVKAFQAAEGLIPDGYASLEVLKRLR